MGTRGGMGGGGSFYVIREPEAQPTSPLSSAAIKNAWGYTRTPPTSLHSVMLNEAQGQICLLSKMFVLTHGQLPSAAPKGTRLIRSTVCIHSGYVMARHWLPVHTVQQSWAFWPGCKSSSAKPYVYNQSKIIPIFNHRSTFSPLHVSISSHRIYHFYLRNFEHRYTAPSLHKAQIRDVFNCMPS
jgi:hypothetical protein